MSIIDSLKSFCSLNQLVTTASRVYTVNGGYALDEVKVLCISSNNSRIRTLAWSRCKAVGQ